MRTLFILGAFLLGISFTFGQSGIDSLKKDVSKLKTKVDSITTKSLEDTIFNLSIGARFSFFTTEKSTELYYDINGFIPSLWANGKKKWIKNIGLYSSMRETKFEYAGSEDTLGNKSGAFPVLNEPSLVSFINSDSASVANNSYYRTVTSNNNNQTSLSLFPTIKIFDNLYFFGHVEGIFGSSEKKFTDVLLSSDTNKIAVDAFSKKVNDTKFPFPYKISEGYKLNSISTFIGFGFFLNYKDKNISFQVMPSGGFYQEKRSYKSFSGRTMSRTSHDYFYTCRFALTEHNSGIRIGGDVRGILNTRTLNYSIYISKQWPLSKIADFLKSK